MREEILRELKELAESDYKEFNSSLIPGVDTELSLIHISRYREIIRMRW